MDANQIPMLSAQNKNTNFNDTRYLPTYEETNISYSLRLPAYRSSYIHRFHPYARVTTSLLEERYVDNRDYGGIDEDPLLDLSILHVPIPSLRAEHVARFAHQNQEARVAEQPDEEHEMALVIVNDDAINAHMNEQDDEEGNAEYPRQPSPFLRIDVTEPRFDTL